MAGQEQGVAVLTLVQAQASIRDQLAEHLVAVLRELVRAFTGWYDTAEITRMATQMAGYAESTQRQVAGTTDAYLARVSSEISGRPVAPVGTMDVTDLRKGVTHAGAYGRLADQYRYEVSTGVDEQTGLEHVITRAAAIAQDDVILADRAQSQRFMVVRQVDGFRRVLHPELAKHGSCGLCVAASDRVYSRGDLLPIHDRCNCETLPIINGVDPGKGLNEADVQALYQAAGSTSAAKLKRVRVAVHEHGELGPVLRDASHSFRGPRDVKASVDPARRAQAELAALEETYRKLLARQAGGEDVSKALAYQQQRIAQLRQLAAA